ncbi:MAG: hypothetical protein M0T82_05135 [Desulfobacteraceae bacterium]|nr:hypothetical protein [Desulfobacteraceae bacterium]
MPSSISNSDTRMRSENLGKTWMLALLIAVAALGSWEGFWRAQGFRPSIEDDMRLWHLARSRVSKETQIVFVGSSRIQLGLHPDIFAREWGVTPVNLSIDGNPPYPVLTDLAQDPEFSGLVICSILPRWLGEKTTEDNRASKWVRKYYTRTPLSGLDARLSLLVQGGFVFRYPGLGPEKLAKQVQKGDRPRPAYAPMRPDRFREARFKPEDIPRMRASRIKLEQAAMEDAEQISSQEFQERLASLNADVRKIRQRGGDVVFIRMPSSGEIRDLEAAARPREKYWDVLANSVSATAIHFEDFDGLRHFQCADGSHLDVDQAREFTLQLLKLLPPLKENKE